MNGKDSFKVLDMKNMCRTCLKVPREVFPMTVMELNTYQNLTQKVSVVLLIIYKFYLNTGLYK